MFPITITPYGTVHYIPPRDDDITTTRYLDERERDADDDLLRFLALLSFLKLLLERRVEAEADLLRLRLRSPILLLLRLLDREEEDDDEERLLLLLRDE